jgi:hypothetical protein
MGYSAESSDTDQFSSQNKKDSIFTPIAQSSQEYKYPCEQCGETFKRKVLDAFFPLKSLE